MSKRIAFFACLVCFMSFSTCQNINIEDDSQAEIPTFDVLDGTYVAPKTITITSSTADAIIRYTLDGTAPSKTAGTLYAGPLVLSATGTITIKAVAYTDALLASSVGVATYKIIPLIIAAPETVTASPANAAVSIGWTTIDGATGYNIYYKAGTTVTKTDTKATGSPYTASPATISGLTNGTAYAFIVTAYDADAESDASEVVTATPSLTIPVPAAPVLSPLSREAGKTTATWTAVSGAAKYTLYYKAGSTVSKTDYGQVFPDIASTTTSYMVTPLTDATEYAFIVTATNAGGESEASNLEKVKPGIAGVPTGVAATALSSTSSRISWTAPTGSLTITGYKVFRNTSADSATSSLVSSPFTSPYDNTTGLTGGTTYYYWVKTSTVTGDSDFSAQASVAIPTLDLPGAPGASAAAHATIKKIEITITAPATGGAPASYKLYRATSSGSQGATALATGLSAGVYSDTSSLVTGTTYYYKVSAVNATGEGALSEESSATGAVPPTPTIACNLSLAANRGFLLEYTRYSIQANKITITSVNATAATVTRDGGVAVFSGTGIYANATEYTAAGAGFGASQTINWSGYTTNEWGNSTTATASSTLPSTTVGATTITATGQTGGILRVSCTDVASYTGEYYAAYRSTSSSGPWTHLSTYTVPLSNYEWNGLGGTTQYVCIVAYDETNKYIGTRATSGAVPVP